MELSRKKQIKRKQLPGFEGGYNGNPLDPYYYNQIRDQFLYKSRPQLGIDTDMKPQSLPSVASQPDYNSWKGPDNSASSIGPWFALGSWIGGGIAKGIGAVENQDQLLANAGTGNGSVGGINYTKYNSINPNQIMRDYNKGTALSFLTNPFEGIARLFGNNKQRRQAREAAALAQNLNTANRTGAQTQALQQDFALKYGNPSNQVLYGAAKGKDEGVYTANGIFNMMPNALGQRNEALMENLDPEHPENASATVIKDGKGGVDDVPLSVKPDTKIGGNDIDWNTGVSFKKEILPLATILEHMKKKYYNNQNNLSSLSKPTQRVQQNEANKILSDVVKNLKAYTDQQKWQHDITGYNQPMTAARGKDRTIPPVLGPSTAALLFGDYLYAAGDRAVARGRLGKNETEMHRQYTKDSGKDLYWFGEKHKKDYKSLPKKATVFNPLDHQEYYQQYLDAVQQYPTVDDYVEGEMNNYRRYWEGKKENAERRVQSNPLFNRFAEGKDYHTIPNVLGALTSIGQIIDASKDRVKVPDSHVPHQYAGRVADVLAGIDINEQPGLQQINKAARQADYGIINSGGLSGSQKYLARLTNANNMYTNYLKFLFDSQVQKNAYRTQYANALASLGSFNAQNRQNANQWDLDYYSKAHAARLGGVQMGLRNLMDYINHYASYASKLNQFNKMYNLYAVDTYSRAKNATS